MNGQAQVLRRSICETLSPGWRTMSKKTILATETIRLRLATAPLHITLQKKTYVVKNLPQLLSSVSALSLAQINHPVALHPLHQIPGLEFQGSSQTEPPPNTRSRCCCSGAVGVQGRPCMPATWATNSHPKRGRHSMPRQAAQALPSWALLSEDVLDVSWSNHPEAGLAASKSVWQQASAEISLTF